ncbi:MAG: VWA domain-containing protein [Cyanobacteria bacterium J06621_8]
MTNNCKAIAPGKSLNSWQQFGLNLAARIYGGRDVVIAIDLTESVGLNSEGRRRLRQIVEDTLQSGDTVYIVPFATKINRLQSETTPLALESGIRFKGKPEDIEGILNVLPFESDLTLRNTDIQHAEWFTYKGLARLNQCRLDNGIAPQPQSIVWLTDAPLLTEPGIDSNTWKETPRESPFRQADSKLSKERQSWINALPINRRSQIITTDNNRTYDLTVVDIKPTVQEFCTPAPGGKETCLVNGYLLKLLLFPTLTTIIILLISAWGLRRYISLNKSWKIRIRFPDDDRIETKYRKLKHQEKIIIGDNESSRAIACPGEDIRGHLIRKGNKIYLKPTQYAPLEYRGQELKQEIEISHDSFSINCPVGKKDFEINIRVYR